MSVGRTACPKCGAEMPAGSRYCTSCGAAMFAEETVPPSPLRVVGAVVLILLACILGSIGACFALVGEDLWGDGGLGPLGYALAAGLPALLLLLVGIRLLMRRTVRRRADEPPRE